MVKSTKQDAVKAAMSVATDITNGDLNPEDLDAAVVAECRRLFGRVLGPEDGEIWELQQDIARQVMIVGGCWPAHELYEWAAVTALREGVTSETQKSWIERALQQYDGGNEEDVDG